MPCSRLVILATALVCTAFCAGLLPAHAVAFEGPEWQHALWIAGELQTQPPEGTVALLLGGSCAREATVNDVEWTADVRRLGGDLAAAYNLGSRRQTFEQDVALVKALPKVPMIVYIGVNAGRFASAFTTTTDTTPPASKPSFIRHHYRNATSWTPERKQENVQYWLDHKQAIFDSRYAEHLAQLDLLIDTCVRRGYTAVVLALPRNIAAVSPALDESVGRYLADGRRLAQEHGAAFLDFVPELKLDNDDFFDLNHLVRAGQEVYQARLSYETVRILTADQPGAETAAGTAGGQAATQTAGSQAQNGSGRALWPVAFGIVLVGVTLAAMRRRAVVRRARRRRRRRAGPRAHGGS